MGNSQNTDISLSATFQPKNIQNSKMHRISGMREGERTHETYSIPENSSFPKFSQKHYFSSELHLTQHSKTTSAGQLIIHELR